MDVIFAVLGVILIMTGVAISLVVAVLWFEEGRK